MSFHLEGSARILLKGGVFMNPAQVFNRDLTMLVASAYSNRLESPSLSIFEPLAATGLRSIRYYKELSKPISRLVANDIDSEAVSQIKENFALNNVPGEVWQQDAINALHTSRSTWDIVDLDPYGSAASFLDGAVLAAKDGGLICVTSTDMITLCGNNPDTCFYKYQSLPSKSKYCHEFAVRILLYQLSATANKYQLAIVPYLSLAVDFYVRVFVKVVSSAATAKLSLAKSALVLQCSCCPAFLVQPLGRANSKKWTNNYWTSPACCQFCGAQFIVQGPVYAGKLHDKEFVKEVMQLAEQKEFKTKDKVVGILNSVYHENEALLGWNIGNLCKFFKSPAISQKAFRSAVRSLGKEVSQAHTSPLIYKTSASCEELFEIFRQWKAKAGPDAVLKNLKEESSAFRVLSKKQEGLGLVDFDLDFTEEEKNVLSQLRFPANEPGWGPKPRPVKLEKVKSEGIDEKEKEKEKEDE
jgi:tRNA (guanine26-N2/guanine27-N2)-dimethyltransferase